jgi:hypothetical protein
MSLVEDWLTGAVVQKEYSVVYFDLDKFKEYNDCYGYAAGDDDFIAVADMKLGDGEITPICNRFDAEKLNLFSTKDINRGYYMSVNRTGNTVRSPLVTLSAAIITSENYSTQSPRTDRTDCGYPQKRNQKEERPDHGERLYRRSEALRSERVERTPYLTKAFNISPFTNC